MPRRMQQT